MTREQILTKIQQKLRRKKLDELVWGDIVSSISSADASDKQAITVSLKNRDSQGLFLTIFRLVSQKINLDAQTEAESILADDSLTLAEIERIF